MTIINSKSQPVYATLAYFGNEFSVSFKIENSTTSTLSGYGDLNDVLKRFPGIPVIDYRYNDSVFQVLKLNLYPFESCHNGNIALKDYFRKLADMGITIHNYKTD